MTLLTTQFFNSKKQELLNLIMENNFEYFLLPFKKC